LLQTQKAETEADVPFHQGASFAYYDSLDLLKSQLEAFGDELDSYEPIVPDLGKLIK
jgi:hypothetical protein